MITGNPFEIMIMAMNCSVDICLLDWPFSSKIAHM